MSVKFLSAILGPEMAAPILWTPGKCVRSAGKTMSIKFLVLGGGGVFWVWGGGGECRFYFHGCEDFSDSVTIAYLISDKICVWDTTILGADSIFTTGRWAAHHALVPHHCCDGSGATRCRARSAAANFHNIRDVAGVSRSIPHPRHPPKKTLPNLSCDPPLIFFSLVFR